MRVVALHEDVLVATSVVWRTAATLVRAPAPARARVDDPDPDRPLLDVRRHAAGGPRRGEDEPDGPAGEGPAAGEAAADGPREAFLVDSPVLPDELAALPALAEQAGFAVAGLLATHGDWDHLLGREAFPTAALGVGETTAARLRGDPGGAQREVRAFDDEWLVPERPPLRLGDPQALPVPGRVALGAGGPHELELHPTGGHTADGLAVRVPWARTLIVGDHLSPVELPTWHQDGGSRSAYRATLAALGPLLEDVDWVVAGHGGAVRAAVARRIWTEDVRYVDDLVLPDARRGPAQRRHDARNRAAA